MSREQGLRYAEMRAAAVAAGRRLWVGLNHNTRTDVA
jgi:hypothetical protein